MVKSVDILTNTLLINCVGGRIGYKAFFQLEWEIGNTVNLSLNHQNDLRKKGETLRLYHKRLLNFVEFKHDLGVCRLYDITKDIIMIYVSM